MTNLRIITLTAGSCWVALAGFAGTPTLFLMSGGALLLALGTGLAALVDA